MSSYLQQFSAHTLETEMRKGGGLEIPPPADFPQKSSQKPKFSFFALSSPLHFRSSGAVIRGVLLEKNCPPLKIENRRKKLYELYLKVVT